MLPADPTEIFPLAIRAKGNAFGIVGWSLGCGSVSLAAPNMFGKLGPNAFYIHAVFNIFAMACVYCVYPETSCRTLEEVSQNPFHYLLSCNPSSITDTNFCFRLISSSLATRSGNGIQRRDSKSCVSNIQNWFVVEHIIARRRM